MSSFTLQLEIDLASDLKSLVKHLSTDVVHAASGALWEEGNEIMRESKNIVPVDEGNLRASGTVHPPEVTGNSVTVTLSYGGPSVDYAVIQHETPPTVFSHSPGQSWKFLSRPAYQRATNIKQTLASRILARLTSRGAA